MSFETKSSARTSDHLPSYGTIRWFSPWPLKWAIFKRSVREREFRQGLDRHSHVVRGRDCDRGGGANRRSVMAWWFWLKTSQSIWQQKSSKIIDESNIQDHRYCKGQISPTDNFKTTLTNKSIVSAVSCSPKSFRWSRSTQCSSLLTTTSWMKTFSAARLHGDGKLGSFQGMEDGKMDFPCLGGGNPNIFYFHPENWGRWTHFDEHIFQMGWFNHQLVVAFWIFFVCNTVKLYQFGLVP